MTDLHEIWHSDAESFSSALAVRHLQGFKLTFLTTGARNLFCIIATNFMKIGHTFAEILRFFALFLVKLKTYCTVALNTA